MCPAVEYNVELVLKISCRFAGGDGGDEALTEEQREVLKEKEPLLAAIQASHDMHLSKIDAKEDMMTQQQTRAFNKMIAGDKETAAQRNRSRISEIAALVRRERCCCCCCCCCCCRRRIRAPFSAAAALAHPCIADREERRRAAPVQGNRGRRRCLRLRGRLMPLMRCSRDGFM